MLLFRVCGCRKPVVAITLGRFDVAAVMFCYAAYFVVWAWAVPDMVRQSLVFWIGMVVALLQALWHGWLIRKREREDCFKAFRLNHWLGFAIFAGIALSYLGR